MQFPFQLNGERTNNVVHCRPFWLHAHTHALATRKYAELFKRVHILNGLSLDLLATLEEEKDSCVCQFGAVCGARARTIGGLTARSNTVGFSLRVSVSNLLAFQLLEGEEVIKLEQI